METQTAEYIDREIITLSQNGIWKADGEEITHLPTLKLFSRSLIKDSQGYTLHIGRETKRIEVEDTAYFVRRIDGNMEEGFELSMSDETQEKLDPRTLSYKSGRLTCRIKSFQEEAKFLQTAYIDLLKNLQEDAEGYFLVFNNYKFWMDKTRPPTE